MKNKQIILILIVLSLSLFITSCNKANQGPTDKTKLTPDLHATIEAGITSSQTAITVPVTGEENPNPQATKSLLPSQLTTPSTKPDSSLTPTLDGIFLTVSVDTNCRTGTPYYNFPIVTTINAGQQVEVLGRNTENDSYYIKNPNTPNSFCWLWGKYATITGKQTDLLVLTPQPTATATALPTSSSKFSVSYDTINYCADSYYFKFFISNTSSSITWESIQINLHDTATNLVFIHTFDTFREIAGCTNTGWKENLAPGESWIVSSVNPGEFNYYPAGNLIEATIKLCTADGLTGDCFSQSITFTP